ncbi:MAG: hypothetical protein PSV40_14165 [Polaromonas sp.]|uniref:hypothetical protein n=1 Tax=Polaromonas sp. TaxID=1869339 RepID=UPI0024892EC2|nr:hypothetical protein [Polaromonas sp.]MDI1270226.1 hypothetical protein [Polaromonas sp.]
MNDPHPSPAPASPTPSSSVLLQGRFEGRSAFADLVRQAFAAAAAQGWREIILCDATFEDWPLGERSVAQSLNDWSTSGRTLTMLAQNYDEVTRRHARFVTWRRTWSHIVECRGSGAVAASDLPSAFWSPGWVFERLDLVRSIGVAGSEAARRVALRERLTEKLLRSSPAFPATTLGI